MAIQVLLLNAMKQGRIVLFENKHGFIKMRRLTPTPGAASGSHLRSRQQLVSEKLHA